LGRVYPVDGVTIPVIFMTAKVQQSEVEHSLSQRALGEIKKPFDPMTSPDEVRWLLGR
jgi:two-component system, OmpR family, response regulator